MFIVDSLADAIFVATYFVREAKTKVRSLSRLHCDLDLLIKITINFFAIIAYNAKIGL